MALVLIVDDEPAIVKVTSLRLQKHGYEVISATDGEEGVEVARSRKPDLILLDVKLPNISGFEVCRRIRQDEALKNIPVIFASADGSFHDSPESEEFEGTDYLLKPYRPQDLLEKIEKNLG